MKKRSKVRSKSLVFEQLESRDLLAAVDTGAIFQIASAAFKGLQNENRISHHKATDIRETVDNDLLATLRKWTQDTVDNSKDIGADAKAGDKVALKSDIQDQKDLDHELRDALKEHRLRVNELNKDVLELENPFVDTQKALLQAQREALKGHLTPEQLQQKANDLENQLADKQDKALQKADDTKNADQDEQKAEQDKMDGTAGHHGLEDTQGVPLGVFFGSFDINFTGTNNVPLDATGTMSARMFISKDGKNLTGQIFEGTLQQYLQSNNQFDGNGSLSNGKITATISGPDANGNTIRDGHAEFNVGATPGLQAHTGQFNFVGKLVNFKSLEGKIVVNGQAVGNFNISLKQN